MTRTIVNVMLHRYLEATYRQGKLLAAYLYLPRRSGDVSVRVEEHCPAFLIDWTGDGRPIGIEMPWPSLVTLEGLNKVLAELNLDPLDPEELAPVVVEREKEEGKGVTTGRGKRAHH